MFYIFLHLLFMLAIMYLVWCYVLHKRFESLNKFPGPKSYPFIGNILDIGHTPVGTLESVLKITNLYKPTAKLWLTPGYCYLVTTDPELMELILGSSKYLKKSVDYDIFRCYVYNGLMFSTGSYWQKRRKMLNPAFHPKALDFFNSFFNNGSDELIKILSQEVSGKDLDIYKYISTFALDMLTESIMGSSFNTQKIINDKYKNCMSICGEILVKRAFSLWKRYDILFRLSSDYKIFQEDLEFGKQLTKSLIKERREKLLANNIAQDEPGTDDTGMKKTKMFLDILLSSKIDGEPLSDIDIIQEINTMAGAGFTTTSAFIGFTLYELARNSDIQKKLVAELRTIFGNNKQYHPTMQDYNNMPYMDLVLKESLRLHSPAPLIGRQLEEDVKFKDTVLPKDTIILFFLYGMHRREDLFPNADRFEPDRFLAGSELSHTHSFIPFSAGPRICIGYRYAMLQAKCAVSRILMNFEILPADGEYNMKIGLEPALKPYPGIFVKLKNRELIE